MPLSDGCYSAAHGVHAPTPQEHCTCVLLILLCMLSYT